MESSCRPPTFDAMGTPIAATSIAEVTGLVREWANDRTGRFIGVRDVASTVAIHNDPALHDIGTKAALNLPDGMPIVWLGRLRGHQVKRTCGPDLMDHLLRSSGDGALSHFFLGGKEGVVEKLADRYRSMVPGLRIAGCHAPPFRPMTSSENSSVLDKIKASGADIVWLGISSPKQDVWMRDNVDQLTQTLIGVGAAFDFLSGEVRRAPYWMQKSGLEWLFRLLTEPRRLWRRIANCPGDRSPAAKFEIILHRQARTIQPMHGIGKGRVDMPVFHFRAVDAQLPVIGVEGEQRLHPPSLVPGGGRGHQILFCHRRPRPFDNPSRPEDPPCNHDAVGSAILGGRDQPVNRAIAIADR